MTSIDSSQFNVPSFPILPQQPTTAPSSVSDEATPEAPTLPNKTPKTEFELQQIVTKGTEVMEALQGENGPDEAKLDKGLSELGEILAPLSPELDALNMMIELSRSQMDEMETMSKEVEKLSASQGNPEKLASLKSNIQSLREDNTKLQDKISEKSEQLKHDIQQLKGSVGDNSIAKKSLNLLDDLLQVGVSAGGEASMGIGSLVSPLLILKSVGDVATTSIDYIKTKSELDRAKAELESSKGSGNTTKIDGLKTKILELENQCGALRNGFVIATLTASCHSSKTVSSLSLLLREVLPTISESASASLEAATHIGGVAAGGLGIVLSLKGLYDGMVTTKAIDAERTKVTQDLVNLRQNPKADPLAIKLLETRLHNLDFQEQNTLVDFLKNGVSFTACSMGTVSGSIALAAGTSTIAATAVGTCGISLAATALGLGAGYLVYKNSHKISHQMKTAVSYGEVQYLKYQVKQMDSANVKTEERAKVVRDVLATKINEVEHENAKANFEGKISDVNDEIEQLTARLEGETDPSKRNDLTMLITQLEAKMQTLVNQKVSYLQGIALNQHHVVHQEAKKTDASLAALSKATRDLASAQKNAQRLREEWDDRKLADRLVGVPIEDVASLNIEIKKALANPSRRSEIGQLLGLPNSVSYDDVMAFVCRKV